MATDTPVLPPIPHIFGLATWHRHEEDNRYTLLVRGCLVGRITKDNGVLVARCWCLFEPRDPADPFGEDYDPFRCHANDFEILAPSVAELAREVFRRLYARGQVDLMAWVVQDTGGFYDVR